MGFLARPLIYLACVTIGAFYGFGRGQENCGDGFAYGGATSTFNKLYFVVDKMGQVFWLLTVICCIWVTQELYKIIK